MIMTRSPLVTIFIQVYNTRPYLAACLESVLALEGDYPLEIIIIDDASPDRSFEIVKNHTDPRINLIIHGQNQGATRTANEGYSLAQGQFVARLDSDDCYRPDFLTKTLPVLQACPDVGLVYGDIAHMDAQGNITFEGGGVKQLRPQTRSRKIQNPTQELEAEIGDEFFSLLKRNYVPAPATLVRQEALQQVLPIPSELYWLDWYVSTGIAENWKFAYVDTVCADYRLHPLNMHSTMIKDRQGEKTTFLVLDLLFNDSNRKLEKQENRAQVYSENYLQYAENYFGYGMYQEARCCYRNSFGFDPSVISRPGILRRYFATFLSSRIYNDLKKLYKRWF
jgi:glycosyltransferase involved in cell wall biosynthesis